MRQVETERLSKKSERETPRNIHIYIERERLRGTERETKIDRDTGRD